MNIFRRNSWFFLALSAAVLVGYGCKSDAGKKVIARAGGVKITSADLAKEISNSPPAYLNYLSTVEGKKQFLDILLKEKILINAAEKSGIAKKAEFKNSMHEYEQRMKDQITEYRKGLILREYLRDLKDGELKVSEAEVRGYYDEHTDEFKNPMTVVASHILCLTPEEAEAALARVKKGENFGKVAQEVSKDPSAQRGGMIGEVGRGDLSDLPEFETELFKLKKGQLSGVIHTKIGYHIIKKVGETRMPSQSYEQAAAHIRRILEKQKFDQWMDKTKKDQKVWINEKELAAVPVNTAPEPIDMQSMPPSGAQ